MFDRFLFQVWTSRIPKSLKFCWKNKNFWVFALFNLIQHQSVLGAHLASILEPSWLPKSDKNFTNMWIQDASNFCIDFCTIWVPSWDASWGHIGFQDRREAAPNAAQDWLRSQKAPKRRLDWQYDGNLTLQTVNMTPNWLPGASMLARFWGYFCLISSCFGGLLNHKFTSHSSPHQPGTMRLCVSIPGIIILQKETVAKTSNKNLFVWFLVDPLVLQGHYEDPC